MNVLLEVAASVLASYAQAPEVAELRSAPPSVLATELRRSATEQGFHIGQEVAGRLAGDETLSRETALAALASLDPASPLAREINRAFAARSEMMVIDPVTILAISVLVLAVKVKRIKVAGFEADFSRLNSGALGAIGKIVGMG